MKRIIKFGGSLFDCNAISAALQDWLEENRDLKNIIVCGGGILVDGLRRWDRIHGLSAGTSHWCSVEALSITSEVLGNLLPQAEITDDLQKAVNSNNDPVIFQPGVWLRTQNGLPISWNFTSDSIAASVAVAIDAPELVLMKSALPEEPVDCTTLGEIGLVDKCFSQVGIQVNRIRIVNLRNRLENVVVGQSTKSAPP